MLAKPIPGLPNGSLLVGSINFPNVKPHNEMVDLIIASRSYEANLQVAKMAVEMARQAIELGR